MKKTKGAVQKQWSRYNIRMRNSKAEPESFVAPPASRKQRPTKAPVSKAKGKEQQLAEEANEDVDDVTGGNDDIDGFEEKHSGSEVVNEAEGSDEEDTDEIYDTKSGDVEESMNSSDDLEDTELDEKELAA